MSMHVHVIIFSLISHPSFPNFFSLLSMLSLILLKALFCNSVLKVLKSFTFLKICQNEVFSEERQLMKWVGMFRVGIFRWEGRLMISNFSCGNSPEEIFLEPFCSYNVFILIFQKIINKYNNFQQKDIYFKLAKCRAKFLSRNFLSQWARNIFASKHVKQWKVWLVNKWEIWEKCKS